ncbi:hypothetical protein GCM10023149_01560 [Mucilaginibacter gynuensis]|uniref:Lumazine-binding protein n=1 Tax=Mucilaginibacter gynuensis TaxID=1302236 RepID=A0ABP8FNP8_9SPHI
MKTLKSILLGLALIIVTNVVKADDVAKLTKDHAVSTYVDALAHGKIEGLTEVLDSNAKFSIMRGNKVISYGKNEMLNFYQTTADTEQNCTVNSSTVENNGEVAIVKIDMHYNGFTRSNLVTVANTGDGWKITNVHSVFK